MHQMHFAVIWGQRECELSFSTITVNAEFSLREPVVYRICLRILHFTYCEDKEVVKKESAKELAVYSSNLIREQGFEIYSFSLQVSIPPVILENERSVWLHFCKGCSKNFSHRNP